MLVVPYRLVPRLTDLTSAEITDLFTTVQKVQRMLAQHLFGPTTPALSSPLEAGSFNIAIQDGRFSGQTVPHVHCHIIPRNRESSAEGDAIYDRLQGEEGNVGGGLWDLNAGLGPRPVAVGKFPRIDEEERRPRSKEVMHEEAEIYRNLMEKADREEGGC